MRNEFTRTITETTVKASIVAIKEGKIECTECEPFVVNGKVTEDKAISLAKKKYGSKNQYVVKMDSKDTTYAISIDKFMEHATVVPDKEEKTTA